MQPSADTAMHLKKPLSSSGLKDSSREADPQAQASATAVEELVNSLNKQRLYREVTLAIRTSIRDARAEFSFLRFRGLRSLLNFLRSVSQYDSNINLFCQTQSIPELQVVPVLFRHSLKDSEDDKVESLHHILGVEPMKITGPSMGAEVALALRVLEGCCLLHSESTLLAHQHKAIEILLHILSTRGASELGSCLDALISIMLDSSSNQMGPKDRSVTFYGSKFEFKSTSQSFPRSCLKYGSNPLNCPDRHRSPEQ